MTMLRARTGEMPRNKVRRYSDRARTSRQTFELIRPHLSRFGITRVADQTALDRLGVPVFAAIRPNALSLSMSQGKGVTADDARISAVMEAVEVAIAEAPHCDIESGFRAYDGPDMFDFSYLMPLARGGAATPTARNDLWVAASCFFTGARRMLPLDAVSMRGRAFRLKGISQNTNGLASGNSYEEAGFHAVCELIERDALTFWAATPLATKAARRIDPAGLGDPVVDELCRAIASGNLDLALYDLTQDIGVPTFAAYLGPKGSRIARHAAYATGSGTHPDPVRAAIRALTEAAQSRVTLIASARDDINAAAFKRDALSQVEALLAAPIALNEPLGSIEAPETLVGLRRFVREALLQAGIDQLAIARLDGGDLPVAVVRAFSPQLESHGVNANWRPGERLRRRAGRAA
ncbi:MAG: YcaO-like family protein [Hyphomicrobiaceae bacterium]|nr:YcaO-like family protein [Hyphomicrobiaceae bacterium]